MNAPRVDPYDLGLHDAILSGWYNGATGELAEGFPVGFEDVVADVGCGDGGAASFCVRQGAHVILLDADGERLQRTADRFRNEGAARVESHVADAHRLPVGDASVTRVVCTQVLEHVDNPAKVAAELHRIGRPGALYLVTAPGAAQEHLQQALAPPSYFERPNHIRIFEEGELAALLESAGLVIERRGGYGFFWALCFAFFWQTEVPLGSSAPSLDAWASTWSQVLAGKDGRRIKAALDQFLPKEQVIVASKPV